MPFEPAVAVPPIDSPVKTVIHEFKPQWTVRRGVEQLYEAYRRVGLKLEDFEGPKFKRIDHVKQLLQAGRLDRSLRWTGNAGGNH